MPRYALELDIDGRRFSGTQAQAEGRGRTVHGVLQQAIAALGTGNAVIRCCSRLDAGVSAERLVVDAWIDRDWDAGRLALALADHLPEDAGIRRAAQVPDGFHSRNEALGKTYRYTVLRRRTRPVSRPPAWWVRRIDHPQRLHALAPLLVGHLDLSAFACLRGDGTDDGDPVRTITAASWEVRDLGGCEELVFTVSGSGFLYKQVRGFVGAMIGACQREDGEDAFRAIVHQGRGAPRIGNLAPGEGLCLVEVRYDPPIAWVVP